MKRHHIRIGWEHFWRQIGKLLKNPIFLVLTIVGNLTLFICAFLFFLVEQGTNPNVISIWDSVWWAFVTITSVGYGDIVPLTNAGRVIAVGLMLTGGVLFLSFIALLSGAFIELEFLELRKDVSELKGKINSLMEKKSNH